MENKYIRIPFEVLEDKNLQATTKLLYGLILSLCNQNGYCWASDNYLVKCLSIGNATVTRCIKELVERKLIERNNTKNNTTGKIEKRVIKCLKFGKTINQNDDISNQNDWFPNQNDGENNIYNNTIICDKNDKPKKEKKKTNFIKPTVEEIKKYCEERNNGIDAEYFYEYYEAREWLIKNKPMVSWKASVITWEKNDKKRSSINTTIQAKPKTSECVSEEDWEEIIRRAGLV